MEAPIVLLDDASPGGGGRLLRFARPSRIIAAQKPEDVPAALAALETALAEGRHLAGWVAYELGYALSPTLAPLQWAERSGPLLWFGVFDAPERIQRDTLSAAARAYAGPLRHEWDERAYATRFARVHDYIGAGDIYQANLSFRSRFAFAGDPFALYLGLRDRAQAPHSAFINTGGLQILSLSPELFFEISPEGAIVVRPMKGTAARGTDAVSDRLARANLAESVKDRAENLMIVDLMRNDVGRVAQLGSVVVKDLFSVETYPTLHTMVSTVKAALKPGTPLTAVIEALFPCGSVTGAPKIRAMEIIRELEQSPRGVYCGAIGHFAPDGSARFNVAIRTLTIRGAEGELGIGGAIVHDSVREAEYAECLLKARYYEVARKALRLIETLRFAPAEGFGRLERHLHRMAVSASALGISFDRARAVAALEREASGANGPLRVRMTLDETGSFETTSAPLAAGKPQWRFTLSPVRMDSRDTLLRHKTDWRDVFEHEFETVAAAGLDEIVFLNKREEVTEGSRTNLFAKLDGELVTPPVSAGLLPGCLRQEMLDEGICKEKTLRRDDLVRARALFLGNSLRGLVPAILVQS
ncbi:MAG TPA: aminodeoxychorismate synthase component I [Rhizomicrobium sp.]|nr:aminodeoxychorismate synthase component I [Rhizomicrobium sp.]